MTFPRSTLRSVARLCGRGLHTGVPVNLHIHPSQNGIGFRLGGARWTATPSNVTDTARNTRLGEIGAIEHLMSALAGLEITDAEVELDAPEVPALDGSAREFVSAIQAAGIEPLGDFEVPPLFSRIFLQEAGGLTVVAAKGEGHWRYTFATGARWPGMQVYEAPDAVATYVEEIAPARTFAFCEEVEPLLKMGLGRGLDASSALILGERSYQNEARFPDEPARHKLLDLIGDVYLAGIPIRALSVVAERTGHRANVKLAAMLHEATRPGRGSEPA